VTLKTGVMKLEIQLYHRNKFYLKIYNIKHLIIYEKKIIFIYE